MNTEQVNNVFKTAITKTIKTAPKKRVSVKQQLRDERNRIIDLMIDTMRREKRDVPLAWERGYNSAISHLAILRIKENG